MFDTVSATAPAVREFDCASVSSQTGVDTPPKVARSRRKRALDVAVAGSLLLLFLPLLIVIAAAIRLETPGPALFRQRRTGLNGRVFTIFKLRTMSVVEDGPEVRQAVQNDARTTRLGQVLRKTSVDELPQLINVLLGDMSLVGPRPHAVAHDEQFGSLVPTYTERFRTRPGLTGLAQILGQRGEIRSVACLAERVHSDNTYIDRWRLRSDLAILARTIPLLIEDPRAY